MHAKGGRRDDYRPLWSVLRPGSDPISLAVAVRDAFGLDSLYLADLDAIAGQPPALAIYRRLLDLGFELWIDAGIRDRASAKPILQTGVAKLIVGLETASGPEALAEILASAGPDRVVFSLDLREGRPIVAEGVDWGTAEPLEIAERVVELRVKTVILLDLARVGMNRGVGTLSMLETLSARHPAVAWIAGGGISGIDDLREAAEAGAAAVLVASALHDGRLRPDRER